MRATRQLISRTGQIITLLFALYWTAGCSLTERITRTRTVQVDTVRVDVPRQGHVADTSFTPPAAAGDSIIIEDDRLRLTLWKLPTLPPDAAAEAPEQPRLLVPPGRAASPGLLPPDIQYRLRAEVKPETVRVDVPQKTITEREKRTKFVKQTPDLVQYLIGGLVAIIIVLVVAWRLVRP